MWPLNHNQKGNWYTADDSTMQGLQGYKVFVAIALILGDGLYNFVKIMVISGTNLYSQRKEKRARNGLPMVNSDKNEAAVDAEIPCDEQRRNEMFMKDSIPLWVDGVAPVLAFCNAYGCGLTDWNLASTYGKLAILIFEAWAGKDDSGLLAGLASCGVMMSIVSTAADLMQDFKTGYLTLSSPMSIFLSQVIGAGMGCIIAPCTFWLLYKAFNVGDPNGEYPAPFALTYRNIAILAVQGFGALPKYCLTMCYCFFTTAIVINLIRDIVPKKVSQSIPMPLPMAILFY
eukprot:PITA_08834